MKWGYSSIKVRSDYRDATKSNFTQNQSWKIHVGEVRFSSCLVSVNAP